MKNSEKRFAIFTVCIRGTGEKVMECARKAGARGGTIFKARGTAPEEVTQFINVDVQPEKEIILILVSAADKEKIMKAISSECGISSEANAITFAIPVDETIGVNI